MRSIIENFEDRVKEAATQFGKASFLFRTAHHDHDAADFFQSWEESLTSQWAEFRRQLEDHMSLPTSSGKVGSALYLTPQELEGLPPELIKELSITESDKKDFAIVQIIDELGGVTSVDKILVGLYWNTGEIEKRTRLVARLYRMQQKGLVYAHPEKKGVYATTPLQAENTSNDEGQQPIDLGDDDDL